MDYTGLFSTHLPADVESPDGLRASVKYIFSVTNADPVTLPAEGFTDAVRDAMQRESATLAPYPPPMGHVGLRDLILGNLKERRGIDTDLDSVFLTCGAGGAVETILSAFIDPGDTVLLNVTLDERVSNAFYLTAKVTCEGKLAVRFSFACAMAPVE